MKNKQFLLEIQNLVVKSQDAKQKNKEITIINDLNLTIEEGLVHAIMGPNGSGKSTLSKVLAGHPSYFVRNGKIKFKKQNLLEFSPEERAYLGLFLGFQYPLEINGVTNQDFLRLAYNSKEKFNNREEVDPFTFQTQILTYLDILEMNPAFLPRYLNQGFSGGEKKRNEILQMAVLDSDLAILDETDSGLDIDALKVISKGILIHQLNDIIKKKLHVASKSLLLITHYKRLLDYIEPDIIHIMKQGKIVCSGDSKLSQQLERKGYDWISNNILNNTIEFNSYKNVFQLSKNDKI